MQTRLFDIDTALVTPRTVVRRFREGEGAAWYNLVADNWSRISDLLPQTVETVSDKETAEMYVRQKLAAWLQQQEYCFGMWDNQKALLIGFVRLYNINWEVPSADITFFIDRNFEGKGLMTEVVQTVMRFAFSQLHIEKIRLRTAMDNYATQRVARKCGFRREGDLRSEFRRPSGDLVDVMLFGYTKAEYEKV
jgi:RimJ/RimL family protein N-acetyltransferase